MQQGDFINVFLARHVSGGGLESRCIGHMYGLDGAVRPIQKLGAENHMLQLNI
jgi:hypothetical protein